MNICIYGAGAIGSLFGAWFSKQNKVTCISRKNHVRAIQTHGLLITGKTQYQGTIPFYENLNNLTKPPDLIIVTVKAYDTLTAGKEILKFMKDDTMVLSIQNGLENIEKLTSIIPEKQILAGITSHGSLFLQPGVIKHTGVGKTRIGELDGTLSKRIRKLQEIFIKSGIFVEMSTNIKKDIWKKAIVNASINPLTAIFQCQNGYLLENPILKELVNKVCEESTIIANSNGYDLDVKDMIAYTNEVISDTKLNISSMLQSIHQKKKTELYEINGAILKAGKEKNCPVSLNDMITHIIPLMYSKI